MPELVEDKGTKAIARALDIIDLLRLNPAGITLSEISKSVDLPKSTVHRMLQTLVSRQMVQEMPNNEGHYRLGIGVMALSRAFLEGFDLVREARPFLSKLNQLTEETVHLGMLDPTYHWVVYLDKLDSPQPVRMVSHIGRVVPVHCTSLGKALLANLPPHKKAVIFSDYDFKKFTSHTITSREQMMTELNLTHERGYALDMEEHEPGVVCVGAAITDSQKKPVIALSLSAPATRMSPDRLSAAIHAVREVAAEFSQLLAEIPANEIP